MSLSRFSGGSAPSEHVLWVWQFTDTFDDLEFGSFITPGIDTSNEALRTWHNNLGKDVTVDQWCIFVATNSNSIDGARLQGRENLIDVAGWEIVIDQATGVFSSDFIFVVEPIRFIAWQYHFGDGNVNIRVHCIRTDWGGSRG